MASRILGQIDISRYDLAKDIKILNSITKLPEEYDEFGQGYWKNLSIYNASGRAEDSQFRKSDECLRTEYASKCPEIQRLVEDNFKFTHLKMVRARSLVDGMVIPHRDFVELEKSTTYFRAFVALETNNESFHSDEFGVFQMKAGEVWFLDAGINHAAVNFGLGSRMFLCLDFMFEGKLNTNNIFAECVSTTTHRNSFYVDRKPLDERAIELIINSTAGILNRHTFKDIVFALSKYHFLYDIPVACCYDWIIASAEMISDNEIIRKAKSMQKYLIEKRDIGERYVINDWQV
ncbi:aspartyl/asparaginyl beta-hydroxylase domain-containing protein [Pseudomonas abietaniphila]|uniref:Aspartyl/Asparaginyl beta-hydroxylase n=1 Tax=Pseudomonas abietaniphila TaxID=89065 RepID=A0A1G8HP06_9PSED|nr:aspartyl/asparaginyl beta-hydroxylase domain-containing protein [Pseudomonas abietaniphila]SDI08377.1 Aspartyl/Asparaginyl beta-hydroxylase [Pseudomonas abietaniphila]